MVKWPLAGQGSFCLKDLGGWGPAAIPFTGHGENSSGVVLFGHGLFFF